MPIDDPTDLGNLEYWYSADINSQNSGSPDFRATGWDDDSGSGGGRALAASGNTTTQPVHQTIDGVDVITFDGINDQLFNTAFTTSITQTSLTIVLIVQDNGDGVTASQTWMRGRIPFAFGHEWVTDGAGNLTISVFVDSGSTGSVTLPIVDSGLGWYMIEVVDGGNMIATNSDGDTAEDTVVGSPRSSFGWITLGSGNGSNFAPISIAESLYYSDVKSGADRTDLIAYLDSRLPSAGGGVDGSGTLAIQSPALSGSGQVTATVDGIGSLALQLPALTGIGTVLNEIAGSGELVVPPIQMVGSGVVDPGASGTGVLAVQPLEMSGSASVGAAVTGSGLLAVQSVELSGSAAVDPGATGSGSLAVDLLELSGSGIIGAAVIGSGSLSVASVAVSGAGLVDAGADGSGSLAVQTLQLSGSAQVDAGAVGAGSLAITSVQISGSGTGLPVTNGSGSLSLPSPDLSGAASVDPGASGSGSLSLQPAALSGDGIVDPGSVGAGSLSIAPLELSGAGLSDLGPEGIGAFNLPPLTLSGSGTVENGEVGAGALAIQPLTLSGSGQVTAEVTGQALSLQISSLEITGSGVIFRGTLVDPVDLIIALERNEEILGRGLEDGSLIIGSLEDSDLARGSRGSEPHEIERYVGETKDFVLQMPSAVDGSSFVLVVNPDPKASDNSGNVVEIAGIIDPEDSTKVRFTPTAQDAAIPPRVYAVAIWQTTPESRLHLAADTSMELRRAPNV